MTPTPETTEAAVATSTPSSATGERDIDPSNPGRTVPKKKSNSPFLVHQKWKEEQELRRRKAAERASSGSSSDAGGKGKGREIGEEEITDITGPVKAVIKLFRWAIMATAVVMLAGTFVAGDALWGYRGKYTRLRTYMPYREKIFSLPELAMYNGRDPKKPIYVSASSLHNFDTITLN